VDALKSYRGEHANIMFQQCLDIICMLPFLSITTSIRDAAHVRRTSGNLSNVQSNILERFQQQYQGFLLDSITEIKWLMNHFKLEPSTIIDSTITLLYFRPVSLFIYFLFFLVYVQL
jgi:acid phosphatase family membrane protein YuiD